MSPFIYFHNMVNRIHFLHFITVHNHNQIIQMISMCRHNTFPYRTFLTFSITNDHIDFRRASIHFQSKCCTKPIGQPVS